MISEQTRLAIWHGLWDANRLQRYYLAVHKRYLLIDRLLLILPVPICIAAIGIALVEGPPIIILASFALFALAYILLPARGYAAKATKAEWIARECGDLEIEWRNLYREMEENRVEESEALTSIRKLDEAINSITSSSISNDIVTNERLNQRSADDANEELSHALPSIQKKGPTPPRPKDVPPVKPPPRPSPASTAKRSYI